LVLPGEALIETRPYEEAPFHGGGRCRRPIESFASAAAYAAMI